MINKLGHVAVFGRRARTMQGYHLPVAGYTGTLESLNRSRSAEVRWEILHTPVVVVSVQLKFQTVYCKTAYTQRLFSAAP